ncbi:hypothetical protein K438DRAFT_1765987 [Mycena galopus ATCC 62051]|nr:hypothetical protein K438DRAFT_1765987 [Mycena galopus ATCC 62051]
MSHYPTNVPGLSECTVHPAKCFQPSITRSESVVFLRLARTTNSIAESYKKVFPSPSSLGLEVIPETEETDIPGQIQTLKLKASRTSANEWIEHSARFGGARLWQKHEGRSGLEASLWLVSEKAGGDYNVFRDVSHVYSYYVMDGRL